MNEMTSSTAAQNPFNFLMEQMGKELVDAIPTYHFSKEYKESGYPNPEKILKDTDKCIVKGVFPDSNRPFVAFKFYYLYDLDKGIYKIANEIFFQQYAACKGITWSYNALGARIYKEIDVEESWVGNSDCCKAIFKNGWADKKEFEILTKLIRNGKDETTKFLFLSSCKMEKYTDKNGEEYYRVQESKAEDLK